MEIASSRRQNVPRRGGLNLAQEHESSKDFGKDSHIAVQSVNNGAVLLGGKAQTMSDHLRAIEIARGVPGVRKVESEIESPDRLADDEIRRNEPSKTEATRSMGAAAKDMTITADTKMRLLADSDVPALDVNVDTFNGTVTLWGSVPTQQAKAAAEADARKVVRSRAVPS